ILRLCDHDAGNRVGVLSGQTDYFGLEIRSEDVWLYVVFPGTGRIFLFRVRATERSTGGNSRIESLLGGLMPGGVTTDVKTYSMLINGVWVASKSAKTFPVYDPSTEEVIAQVPDANADDVDRAVAAARAAFEEGPWATTTAQERGRVLFRLAEKVRQNLPMLAELECRNSGKPIVEAEFDITDVATCFEYYGGLATKVVGYVNPVPDNAMSLSLKEPMGVAGQIIPWNYPLMMA